jgi:hypothetical protein
MKRMMKPLDYGIFVLILGLVAVFTALTWQNTGQVPVVEITSEEGKYVYTLETDADIVVSGPIGDTHLEIRNGAARFTESPCRDKICILTGELEHTRDWSACLPNKVFASIVGVLPDKNAIDAVVF